MYNRIAPTIKKIANKYELTGLINNKYITLVIFGFSFVTTSYNIYPKYYKKKLHIFFIFASMKKIALFIGLFFYLLAASGASLHLHFCQGETKSVSLSESHNTTCPLCAKSKEKQQKHCHETGSCKDVKIEAKKVDHFSRVTQNLDFNTFSPAIVTLHWILNYYHFSGEEDDFSKLKYTDFGSDNRQTPPVFILNQNFRI